MRSFLKGCFASAVIGAMILFSFTAGFVVNAYRSGSLTAASYTNLVVENSADASVEIPKNFGIFYEVLDLLNNEFHGDLPAGKEVQYAAIRGVLAQLEDPATILVEPEAHQRERQQFKGEFGGIGAYVGVNEDGLIEIVSPIADTPAERADLRPNDIILEVDGTDVTNMPLNEVVDLIRGPVGTDVTLLLRRSEVEEDFTVTITRATIPDPTVAYQMVEESNIGYMQLRFFSDRSPDELKEAIKALREEGAEKLILDLRNNPGGVLDSAVRTASLFLDEDGPIVYQESRDGSREPRMSEGEPIAMEEPLVVLINEGSASASEVVAGALKDYGRATLVGTQSYGKGTVQIPYTLQDGSSLHVTVARWLTPDGVNLGEQGLTPNVVVKPTEEQRQEGQDPVYEKAIELLEDMD